MGKEIVIGKVLANMISAIVDLIDLVPIGDEITISPPHNGHIDVQLKAGPTREVIKKVHVPLDDLLDIFTNSRYSRQKYL